MVKRSRRDDLQSTNFNQMTTSNMTAATKSYKGLKKAFGATALSILLPLGLVMGALAISAPNAEAYSSCTTRGYGNTYRTTCY